MKNLNLFPIPVSKFELDPMSDEEENFLKKSDFVLLNSEYLDARNSINKYVLNEKPLVNLKKRIQECIDKYKYIMMRCDQEIYITNSWVNLLEKGKRHSLHYHGNSFISGVFYVETNNNHPGIRFENPSRMWPLTWQRTKFNDFNSESWVETVEKNTLILFPSLLWHSVDINNYEKERISLSFNTFIKGKLSTDSYLAELELK